MVPTLSMDIYRILYICNNSILLTIKHSIQWNLSTVGTIGTQLAVVYTTCGTSLQWAPLGPSWLSCILHVEPLYSGHHWDPAGCRVYYMWNLSTVDTIGTQLAVVYTVERLYSGHHWDQAGCRVYNGTSLQWTPLGPSWLSCIQWNLSTVGTIGTQLAVMYTTCGTSLQWTPLGPSWLSCIQWNLSTVDTIGTQLAVVYTVEPLYSGHYWDPAGCRV